MKPFIMQFSPSSSYFLSTESKYAPQHFGLKHHPLRLLLHYIHTKRNSKEEPVFWDLELCSLIELCRRFGGKQCSNL
jgi:hypothetical protein